MKAILISGLTAAQHRELDLLYRKTKDPRLRTRAQMILLSVERGLKAVEIAAIVREGYRGALAEAVSGRRRGRTERCSASGTPSQSDSGCTALVAAVRRRPHRLDLPFSLWTLQRLTDYLAEQTGIRIALETLRQVLKREGMVLSRPQHKISSPDPDYAVKKKRSKTAATT